VHSSQRLKDLHALVAKIDLAILGNDWESKKMLKELRSKVVAEIKTLQSSTQNMGIVK
jgi:hypothetical protein